MKLHATRCLFLPPTQIRVRDVPIYAGFHELERHVRAAVEKAGYCWPHFNFTFRELLKGNASFAVIEPYHVTDGDVKIGKNKLRLEFAS